MWAEGHGFSGFVPSPLQPKDMKPYLDWSGGRIPVTLWQTILAFFKAHADNEVQVRLYYNPDTLEWKAHAFPQEYPSGMTTKEIPEHPHTAEDAAMFSEPWVRMGSVHHHCSSSAFQSGTDKGDEETVCGLHITVGKLKDAVWDIHSRVSIRLPGKLDDTGALLYGPTQAFYEADLTQWFMLPQSWQDILPPTIQAMTLKHILTCPPDKTIGFPERWEQNLIRRERPNGPRHHQTYPSNGGGASQHGSNGGKGSEDGKGTVATGSNVVHLPSSAKRWDTLTPQIIDLIATLIEVFHDQEGKFMCQAVETMRWKDAQFASLQALESILRTSGFEQIATYTWAFPQDREKVQAALQSMAEQEMTEEAKRWEHESAHGYRGAVD